MMHGLPLFRQEGVARFVGLGHLSTAEECCDAWFDRAFKRYEEQKGGLNVLIDKQTGKLVRQSGLLIQHVDGMDRLEVGYSILPEYWQKDMLQKPPERFGTMALRVTLQIH